MPIRVDRGASVMNFLAASCAATMRVGCTSVARIDPDTSIARITVSCADGSVITAAGRAVARINATSASANSSGGRCRRMRPPGPIAPFTSARLA